MFFLGKKLKVRGSDKEVNLSPLEFMILLKVYEADPVGISGYDIINELTATFAGMWVAQSGTVYPLLSRMQDRGLVTSVDMKSELGPTKKVYKITLEAKDIIELLIIDNFQPELQFFGNYLEFVMKLMFKLKRKESISAINFEQVRAGLDLFAAHLQETQAGLGEFMSTELAGKGLKCPTCGEPVDRGARFCPRCGKALA